MELRARESLDLVGVGGGVRSPSLLHRSTSLSDGPEDSTGGYSRELLNKPHHDRWHKRVPTVSSGGGTGHGIHPTREDRPAQQQIGDDLCEA